MSHLVFYSQPEILNRFRHRHYRVRTGTRSFSFAAHTNSVILCGSEFIPACREFPILFIRNQDKLAPIALLGLRDSENLFVNDTGEWGAGYIPAFVRRYPFVLIEEGNGFSVGFDAVSPDILTDAKDEGEPLFGPNDEPSKFLADVIEFLKSYQAAYLESVRFGARLQELGVLRDVSATADLGTGSRFVLNGLFAVDAAKLAALDASVLKELAQTPSLSWIYAHLASLELMPRLAQRLAPRVAGAPAEAGTVAEPLPAATDTAASGRAKPATRAKAQAVH
jgi:hypothetical protein